MGTLVARRWIRQPAGPAGEAGAASDAARRGEAGRTGLRITLRQLRGVLLTAARGGSLRAKAGGFVGAVEHDGLDEAALTFRNRVGHRGAVLRTSAVQSKVL